MQNPTNTEPTVVLGTYTGTLNDGTIEWLCPIENLQLWTWGQFYYDRDLQVYVHHVFGFDGNLLYIVHA